MYAFFVLTRQERTQAQQLRDEQDEAYYESVRADQEKVSRYNCSCLLMAFIACELLVYLFIMLFVQPFFIYNWHHLNVTTDIDIALVIRQSKLISFILCNFTGKKKTRRGGQKTTGGRE